jgi:hypothetical protein
MQFSFTKVNIKEALIAVVVLTLAFTAFATMAHFLEGFYASRIVPGLTYASATAGLLAVRKAWKAGKKIRTALKAAFGWTIASLIISVIGDATITYLLNNHIDFLASW